MTEIRHKRGDVREDGMRFWQYRGDNLEYWVSEERFRLNRDQASAAQRARRLDDTIGESLREKDRNRRKDPLSKDNRNALQRQRFATDPLYRLSMRVRNRVNAALKRKGFPKVGRTADTVGCSFEELKAHIESQFTENMSWDNFGKWHIDHIKPLASAQTPERAYELTKYTNLQPLWAKDNLSKGAKILN
jgi:hypothetical protein